MAKKKKKKKKLGMEARPPKAAQQVRHWCVVDLVYRTSTFFFFFFFFRFSSLSPSLLSGPNPALSYTHRPKLEKNLFVFST